MSAAVRFVAMAVMLGLVSGCATVAPETGPRGGRSLCNGVQRAAGADKGGTLQGAMRGAWAGMKAGAQSAAHCSQDGVCQAMALVATLVGATCGLAHGEGDGAAGQQPADSGRVAAAWRAQAERTER